MGSLLSKLIIIMVMVPALAAAWTLDLADSVSVNSTVVHLDDVSLTTVPSSAAEIVVSSGARPGSAVTVSRRAILRHLVQAGQASEVRFAGADKCHIAVHGVEVASNELVKRVRELVTDQIPEQPEEAPPSWLALEVPHADFTTSGQWSVTWPQPRPLTPGRNLLTVMVDNGQHRRHLSVVAVLHSYALTARATAQVARGQATSTTALQWEWADLAQAGPNVVTSEDALVGMVASRTIKPGETLANNDLKPQPIVNRGETVELIIRRGTIEAVVKAECRQDGLLGQLVSVRNKLNGKMVVATVAAPGVVTLGR